MNFFKNKAEREADAHNARMQKMRDNGVKIPEACVTIAIVDGEINFINQGSFGKRAAMIAFGMETDPNIRELINEAVRLYNLYVS